MADMFMKIQLLVIFPNCRPYRKTQNARMASAPNMMAVPPTAAGGIRLACCPMTT